MDIYGKSNEEKSQISTLGFTLNSSEHFSMKNIPYIQAKGKAYLASIGPNGA